MCFYDPFNSALYSSGWMIHLLVTGKLLHQILIEKKILPCPLQCWRISWNFQRAWLSLLFWWPKTDDVLPNYLKFFRLFWKAANGRTWHKSIKQILQK